MPTQLIISSDKNGVSYEKNCSACQAISSDRITSEVLKFQKSEICSERILHSRTINNPHWDAWVIEIQQECNLSCPMCIAGSGPGKGKVISVEEFSRRLENACSLHKAPDILLISGGEPTIHSEVVSFIAKAKEAGFTKVIIITNGVRLAEERDFASKLKTIDSGISFFLQFDSLDPDVLRELRGSDLSDIRKKSISALENAELNYTLISVIKRGLNENKILDSLKFLSSLPHAEGIQFQPIRSSGRHTDFDFEGNSLSKFCVEQLIEQAITNDSYLSLKFHPFENHPNNPRGLSIAGISDDGFDYPTSRLFPEWEYNSQTSTTRQSKRIYIQEYQDSHSFTFENDRLSNIGILLPMGRVLALDRHYIGI